MRRQGFQLCRRQRGQQVVLVRTGERGYRHVLVLCREFHADAAVADEPARLVEHRLAAYLKSLLRAIKVFL